MLVIKELCALLLTYSLIAFTRGFEVSNSSYLQQMMNIRQQKVEEINNYKKIFQKVGGKDCSYGLTISSSGPAGRIQGSVLGDYRRRDEHIMLWPTWDMICRDNRYLYRCPCGKKIDWLFGKLNGYKDGWIKHRNCTGCPESCSQGDWLYWDDT